METRREKEKREDMEREIREGERVCGRRRLDF
jgi:hypothetical protein